MEHVRDFKRQGWMQVIAAVVFLFCLSGFALGVVRPLTYGVIVLIFGSAIFLPIILWEAIRHLRKGGEFRSWLTQEQFGQAVPFLDTGKSFEVSLQDIATLHRIDPPNEGRTRYLVETTSGAKHEVCDLYGNPVDRYFKEIQARRPEVELQVSRD